MTIAATIFILSMGAFLGFLRGETIPGRLGGYRLTAWLFQESADGKWTLRRWAMIATAGLMQALAMRAIGDALPWYAPLIVWAAIGAAWSMPHSPFIPDSDWMIAISGLAMTILPAVALAFIGDWIEAAGCITAGAIKPLVYAEGERLTPPGLPFPFWWSVLAEIVNGALEIGVPTALLMGA